MRQRELLRSVSAFPLCPDPHVPLLQFYLADFQTSSDAAGLVRTVMRAVGYIHGYDAVHRGFFFLNEFAIETLIVFLQT